MTAAEIQQRVDAWLAGRSAWLGQDDARWSLASQWQAVARQFGPDSPAALGVLLGLVRAACDGVLCIDEFYDAGGEYVCEVSVNDHYGCGPAFSRASMTEALLAALEAAP